MAALGEICYRPVLAELRQIDDYPEKIVHSTRDTQLQVRIV